METTKSNVAAAPAAEKEVKKVRRGVGSARGVARLKFSHELAQPNGLFLGHLENVVVSDITIGEDKTGMPSFNGLSIPKISFTFASNESDASKRHFVNLNFTAVESNADTIPGGKEAWKVDSVFMWLKHILNVFVLKGRELTDEEESALSVDYEDFDESGEYVPVEPETVAASWKRVFENFENIMNRGADGKEVYKTKDGKFITIWMKLLRAVRTPKKDWKNVANGDLAFPTFIGEGCIEIYKANVSPSIRIDALRESILPRVIDKPKTPNMPAVPTMAPTGMGGGVALDPMAGIDLNDIAGAPIDDMPFGG